MIQDLNQINSQMKAVKIVFMTTGLSTGGAEVMLYNLLSNIDRNRFEPTVISLMSQGPTGKLIEDLGIPIYCAEMLEGKPSIASGRRIIKLLKQIQPDLIQGWMYHGNLAAQVSNFFAGQKAAVLWSIHHSLHDLSKEKPLTQKIIHLGSWTSKFVGGVAYVSDKSQIQHHKIGYSKTNSCLIPNGFDTSKFRPSSEIRKKFRQDLNILDDQFLIGTLARYHPMKDHANFLKAAKVLLENYPETMFVMIGTDVDYENSNLTDLIDELGIGKNIRLLGRRNDIPQITPALDIVATSSAFGEAFPMVIGEAMSCGIPCVVTDIGDSAWIVGDTGKVVPPKDSNALATAWQDMIDLDKSAREKLGESARKRIVENFSLNIIIEKYEQMYQRVLAEKN